MCAQPQPGAALSAEEQEALDARLYAVAEGGDAAAVVRLAGEGASADANPYGYPAVVRAAEEGHTEVVEALLRLGCDPNAADSYGNTALVIAAIHGTALGGGLVKKSGTVEFRDPHRDSRAHFCSSQVRHHRKMSTNVVARLSICS